MLQLPFDLIMLKDMEEIQTELERAAKDLGTEVDGGSLEVYDENEVVVHICLKCETWQKSYYGTKLKPIFESYLAEKGQKLAAMYIGGFTI